MSTKKKGKQSQTKIISGKDEIIKYCALISAIFGEDKDFSKTLADLESKIESNQINDESTIEFTITHIGSCFINHSEPKP